MIYTSSLPSYNELARLDRQSAADDQTPLRIAVLGDASTQWLVIALRGYARTMNLRLEVYESGFDQIDNEIANPGSGLFQFDAKYVVIVETSRRLQTKFRSLPFASRHEFAQLRLELAKERLRRLKARIPARVILFDVEPFHDGVYGDFSASTPDSLSAQLVAYNAGLWKVTADQDDVFLFPFSQLAGLLGQSAIFDSRLYTMAEAAYSLDFLPTLASRLMGMIGILEGRGLKCLVLDLDNTLWGGVVGDLGYSGIDIGNLGPGRAFEDFQSLILDLKHRGIILAVVSKNELDVAQSPFLQRPEMRLKLEDFAVFLANWNPKHENILQIQRILNIGLDAIVFLDDNPLERDSVRKFLPDVVVPDMPANPEDYSEFLASLSLFGVPKITREDSERTLQYQAEASRQTALSQFESFDDYLNSLQMRAEVEPMTEASRGRLSQLFLRSNQFNTRTVRYSEADLAKLQSDSQRAVISCRLSDQFGDYGIVSAAVLNFRPDAAFLENWVMSCRVFNRRLEHFLMNQLVALSRSAGCATLLAERVPTPKNKVIESLFSDLGFAQEGDLWALNLATAAPHKHFIHDACAQAPLSGPKA